MPILDRRSHFRKLFVVAISLIGIATLAIGMTIWWLRSDAIKDASKDTANLAVVLAEQTTRSIQSIDLVLNEIREHIEPLGVRAPNDFDRVLSLTLANFEVAHRLRGTRNIGSFSTIS
jgi:hypothetical protein